MESQLRLVGQSVAVVGAGGIGSTVLLYLAAAGVGCLRIIDGDTVDESNLHRQIVHDSISAGIRISSLADSLSIANGISITRGPAITKVESAAQRLRLINPHIAVDPIARRLTAENAVELLSGCNLVVDATDNVTARYVLNDACINLRLPLVTGSAIGLEGQVRIVLSLNSIRYSLQIILQTTY